MTEKQRVRDRERDRERDSQREREREREKIKNQLNANNQHKGKNYFDFFNGMVTDFFFDP